MNAKEKIDQNYEWFQKNRDNFIVAPGIKFVIINDCQIIASFAHWEEATRFAYNQRLEEGYIIQNIFEKPGTNFLGFFSIGL